MAGMAWAIHVAMGTGMCVARYAMILFDGRYGRAVVWSFRHSRGGPRPDEELQATVPTVVSWPWVSLQQPKAAVGLVSERDPDVPTAGWTEALTASFPPMTEPPVVQHGDTAEKASHRQAP